MICTKNYENIFKFVTVTHKILQTLFSGHGVVQGEHPQNSGEIQGWGRSSQQKTCNISETGQDMSKVTIDDQQEVVYALSIGTKINDLG